MDEEERKKLKTLPTEPGEIRDSNVPLILLIMAMMVMPFLLMTGAVLLFAYRLATGDGDPVIMVALLTTVLVLSFLAWKIRSLENSPGRNELPFHGATAPRELKRTDPTDFKHHFRILIGFFILMEAPMIYRWGRDLGELDDALFLGFTTIFLLWELVVCSRLRRGLGHLPERKGDWPKLLGAALVFVLVALLMLCYPGLEGYQILLFLGGLFPLFALEDRLRLTRFRVLTGKGDVASLLGLMEGEGWYYWSDGFRALGELANKGQARDIVDARGIEFLINCFATGGQTLFAFLVLETLAEEGMADLVEDRLLDVLDFPNVNVRAAAVRLLGTVGSERAVPELETLLGDEESSFILRELDPDCTPGEWPTVGEAAALVLEEMRERNSLEEVL